MVESIREHPRLEKQVLPGERFPLSLGTLFIPPAARELPEPQPISLVIAFHCGDWIPEIAVSNLSRPVACLCVQLGAGSSRYAKPFMEDSTLLDRLVAEASQKLNRAISELILIGWSAGYGAIGQILEQEHGSVKISAVMLIDGLHTGYVDGSPGPSQSTLQTDSLLPYLKFARRAVQKECRLVIIHSEIFPGTYASTTETADWLLTELNLRRQAILRWGPMKTQILAETQKGGLTVRAFAGNSAPDHVDLLHALPDFLVELLAE